MLGDKGEIGGCAACHELPLGSRLIEKTQVAMIILYAFLLELIALLRRKLVTLPPRFARRSDAGDTRARLAVVWSLPIGPTAHFHLKNAEVYSKLQLFVAIQSDNLTDFDCAYFMRPIFQVN